MNMKNYKNAILDCLLYCDAHLLESELESLLDSELESLLELLELESLLRVGVLKIIIIKRNLT